ncbi:MAG: hypothetical protein ACYCXG_01350 [Acidiferrobacter sp.]
MRLTFEQNAQILGKEAFSHRRFVAGTFIAVTVLATIAGVVWPRDYDSTAMILVNNKRLIDPLIQGAAYQPDVGQQRARISEDLIRSREVLVPAMIEAGLYANKPSPRQQADMLKNVRSRTSVMEVGKNLIRVSYRDTNATRAYALTKAMVAQFIGQDRKSALGQAQEAYSFLNAQVVSYRHRLMSEAAEIARLKANTLDASASFAGYERRHINHLQAAYDKSEIELRADQARARVLGQELTGQGHNNSLIAKESLDRSRLIADEAQLSKLSVYYRSTYPGVQILRREVKDLRTRLAALQAKEKALHPGHQILAFAVGTGGFYQHLEAELDNTQAHVATLEAEAAESRHLLATQTGALKDVEGASPVAALLHDYRTNQQTLDGLLQRREQAQVSLNLNRERQALSFRVYEPANLPAVPLGPPFALFVIGGIVLGIILPFGLLYGRNQMDARVRAEAVIPETLNLPLLASVPHLYAPSESLAARRNVHWLGVLVFSVLFIVISIVIAGKNI